MTETAEGFDQCQLEHVDADDDRLNNLNLLFLSSVLVNDANPSRSDSQTERPLPQQPP